MIAYLILGQRKDPYPAENPECLDVQTESGFVEAYARIGSLVEAYRKSGQFEAVGQLAIEIPDDAIQAALAPKRETVPVKVLPEPAAKPGTRPGLGGWAPGEYLCRCRLCGKQFVGDKRAYHCESCAYSEGGE